MTNYLTKPEQQILRNWNYLVKPFPQELLIDEVDTVEKFNGDDK